MKRSARKQSYAIGYLRQLCCSGLDKGLIIQEFLRAVRPVISSSNNVFGHLEEGDIFPQTMTFGYLVPEVVSIYDHLLASYWTQELLIKASAAFKQQAIVGTPICIDDHFYQSDLYHLGHVPCEQHHCIATTVLHFNQPLGFICLYRPVQQPDFLEKDKLLLLQLMPYLAHAISAPPQTDVDYCEKGSLGLMIMDGQGKMQFQSQIAKYLFELACFPVLRRSQGNNREFLYTRLAQLCRQLSIIYLGHETEPPSFCLVNTYGRFIFRAQWLDKLNSEPDGLIGMSVEHQEPLLIKILRGLRYLPLSPVQLEVAALVAKGFSNEEIGKRLHIKLTTVKDHVRKIFDKLDIHSREELLPLLLAKASATVLYH